MRKSMIVVLIFCLGTLLFTIVSNWPEIKNSTKMRFKNKVDENSDFQKAEKLSREGDIPGALDIIQRHENPLDYDSDNGKRWVDLLISISSATFDTQKMIHLYENFPQAFNSNEDFSLNAADAYIVNYRPNEYEELREKWKGLEKRPEDWLVLDSDALILNNQRDEAIKLLRSRTFDGPQDTGRLIRLGLLNLPDNSNAAWGYFSEALKKDPSNPDIHSYRGRLLESTGKKSSALSEYLAAVQLAPENIVLMNQLGEFYLREDQYQQAMAIWLEALKEVPYEPLLIKVLFWNRVVTPKQYDWHSILTSRDELSPFALYMIDLSPNRFWNEATFNKIPNGQRFLTSQQATFWLRMLQNLKDGKEKEASELLLYNPFNTELWNEPLKIALLRILNFRKNGSLRLDEESELAGGEGQPRQKSASTGNNFFDQLDKLALKSNKEGKSKLPKGLQSLLLSPEIFTAALLSTGWFEAALDLHKLEVYPPPFPSWVAVKMMQALQTNRTSEEALTFASKQQPSKPLSLTMGELLTSTRQTDKAIEKLAPLAQDPSNIGVRASLLISSIYFDRGEYQQAEKVISSQPLLDNAISGKEAKARIALSSGNEKLAIQRYTDIQEKSAEAKSFLARKAFDSKDWTKAKILTEELLQLYPDNALLHENLKRINEEQQTKT